MPFAASSRSYSRTCRFQTAERAKSRARAADLAARGEQQSAGSSRYATTHRPSAATSPDGSEQSGDAVDHRVDDSRHRVPSNRQSRGLSLQHGVGKPFAVRREHERVHHMVVVPRVADEAGADDAIVVAHRGARVGVNGVVRLAIADAQQAGVAVLVGQLVEHADEVGDSLVARRPPDESQDGRLGRNAQFAPQLPAARGAAGWGRARRRRRRWTNRARARQSCRRRRGPVRRTRGPGCGSRSTRGGRSGRRGARPRRAAGVAARASSPAASRRACRRAPERRPLARLACQASRPWACWH